MSTAVMITTTMQAHKIIHSYFPTGKGLLLEVTAEFAVLYAMPDGNFTYYDTCEQFVSLEQAKQFLNESNAGAHSSQGVSQTADLQTILSDLSNDLLGEIYEECIGYNPFKEPNEKPEDARALCLEVMTSEEYKREIFGI
jgi:hypothetical protein